MLLLLCFNTHNRQWKRARKKNEREKKISNFFYFRFSSSRIMFVCGREERKSIENNMIPFCLSVSFNVPKERGSHVVLVRNSFLWSFTRCWFKSLDTSENMCEKNGKMKPYGVSCLWNRLVVIMDDLSKRNLNSSLSPSLFSLKRCLFLWAMRKNTEIYQDWNRISSVCCPFLWRPLKRSERNQWNVNSLFFTLNCEVARC